MFRRSLMDIKSLYRVLVSEGKASMQYAGTHDIFELEQKLSGFYGKKYCILFSNATTAIFTLCLVLNIKKQHVIVPPLTWGGSISPLLFLENQVSFSDVDETLCMDAKTLDSKINSDTSAIISVDYGGASADSKKIKEKCPNNGIFYISDSAQSLGAYRDNKPAGFYADAIITSFTSGKTMYGGEGGAIILDDKELYEKIIFFSQHPLRQKKLFGSTGYNHFCPVNGRINPIAAILLNSMFEENLIELKRNQKVVFSFLKRASKLDIVELPKVFNKPNFSTYFGMYFKTNKKIIDKNKPQLGLTKWDLSKIENSELLFKNIKNSEYSQLFRSSISNAEIMVKAYKRIYFKC
jgi:perosamine synthetase